MAENESLDLGGRASQRWRKDVSVPIQTGKPDEVITQGIITSLYRTFKNVVGQIPLKDMLDAIEGGGDLSILVRRCDGHEYAQLVSLHASMSYRGEELLQQVVWSTLDRFLDQIRIKAVGSDAWPDFNSFNDASRHWKAAVYDDVNDLAAKLWRQPDVKPRMPAVPRAAKQQAHGRLMKMSLLESDREMES
ncbi:MAG: hypothetical protein QGH60_24370 [Phycisphaerae bacterium]|nr:hypothetical protein [Phycisphaerae bacterium]